MFYKDKNILVTGGTGLIGSQLVELLKKTGANITIASLDDVKDIKDIVFKKLDLRYLENCVEVCRNQEIVFHLAGIKGSPEMTRKNPASFKTVENLYFT